MPCPTCSETLQALNAIVKWCPRCGTILTSPNTTRTDIERPKLVQRCRDYESLVKAADRIEEPLTAWKQAGVDEAINLPEDRP